MKSYTPWNAAPRGGELGQWGGRVHKLHLKRNGNPRNWWAAENETLHRYSYNEDGKEVPIGETIRRAE